MINTIPNNYNYNNHAPRSEGKRQLDLVLSVLMLFLFVVAIISAIELHYYLAWSDLEDGSEQVPQFRKLLEYDNPTEVEYFGEVANDKCYIPPNRNSCAPQFVIVGAMKSGTTSLYGYLSHHPDILPLGAGTEDSYLGKLID
jgi:hypothetical protein